LDILIADYAKLIKRHQRSIDSLQKEIDAANNELDKRLRNNINNQIKKFIGEGGKVYACRFALQALYGHGEPSLIEGIQPISPLDVLDLKLIHVRENAVIVDTWTV
ncbi:MAG: hypothetical protein R3194_08425, partial [Limnobacter sp.]|nr:hypothetical protein [Limnobacter sp.]